jgi:hypothetical protein
MDIPISTVIDYTGGGPRLVSEIPVNRQVLNDQRRSALPAGTVIIDADECLAVAVGDGTFMDTGLDGLFPGSDSVVLHAYIVAGPGLEVHLPGGSTVMAGQDAVDDIRCDIRAVDAQGVLYRWDEAADGRGFVWEKAGCTRHDNVPTFPVIAWRM